MKLFVSLIVVLVIAITFCTVVVSSNNDVVVEDETTCINTDNDGTCKSNNNNNGSDNTNSVNTYNDDNADDDEWIELNDDDLDEIMKEYKEFTDDSNKKLPSEDDDVDVQLSKNFGVIQEIDENHANEALLIRKKIQEINKYFQSLPDEEKEKVILIKKRIAEAEEEDDDENEDKEGDQEKKKKERKEPKNRDASTADDEGKDGKKGNEKNDDETTTDTTKEDVSKENDTNENDEEGEEEKEDDDKEDDDDDDEVDDACYNNDKLCIYWSTITDWCNTNPSFMYDNCKPSCKFCGKDDKEKAIEKIEKLIDEVDTSYEFGMKQYVPEKYPERLISVFCLEGDYDYYSEDDDEDEWEQELITDEKTGEEYYSRDYYKNINVYDETLLVINRTKEYVDNVVHAFEETTGATASSCYNRNEKCSYWTAIGKCRTDPSFMHYMCAPACRTCDKAFYLKRCPEMLTIHDKPIVLKEKDDLNKMMYNMISNKTLLEKYGNPTILSYPHHDYDESLSDYNKNNLLLKNKNKEETDDGVDDDLDDDYVVTTDDKNYTSSDVIVPLDGPWVLTFDDVLTPEECERMIYWGNDEGYHRSSNVGEKNFDGTAEESIDDTRTSTNAWCNEGCYEDPVTLRIMDKIHELTKIPMVNYEYFQILKYHPGQYYKRHHDLIDDDINKPQGVRMLTVFLYLNNIDESITDDDDSNTNATTADQRKLNKIELGGGTRFPNLDNLTVIPKLGKAVIWPSVTNDDPNKKDWSTEHEALTVQAGYKYAINTWIHQRDYEGPEERGCT